MLTKNLGFAMCITKFINVCLQFLLRHMFLFEIFYINY
jgi:hypothetical protein